MERIIGVSLWLILLGAASIQCHNAPRINPHDGVTLHRDATTGRADCIIGDIFCGTACTTLEYCSSNGPIVVETCPPGSLCNAVNLTCVVGGLCLEPVNFVCNSLGLFPDPFDCKKYHVCEAVHIGIDSWQLSCDAPHAYDPLSGLCIKTMQDRVCTERPIPLCTAVGQIGPQIENPNIYYLCRRTGDNLYPSLYRCLPDEEFVINKCVEVSVTTTSSIVASSTSSSATSTSVTVTTTTPGGTTITSGGTTTTKFPCTSQGQFPDPLDCRGYYVCTQDLIAYHFRCREEFHYDSLRRVCATPECVGN